MDQSTPCQIRTDDHLPEKQRGWTATLTELALTISVSIVVFTEAFLKEGLLLLCLLDCPVEQDHDQKDDSDYQKNDVDKIHDQPLSSRCTVPTSGFEPLTSLLSARRSNQLSYAGLLLHTSMYFAPTLGLEPRIS